MKEEVINKLQNKELMYDLHITRRLSPAKIADEIGCSRPTVRDALKRLGIYQKKKNQINR